MVLLRVYAEPVGKLTQSQTPGLVEGEVDGTTWRYGMWQLNSSC